MDSVLMDDCMQDLFAIFETYPLKEHQRSVKPADIPKGKRFSGVSLPPCSSPRAERVTLYSDWAHRPRRSVGDLLGIAQSGIQWKKLESLSG